jgi:hypothetical protein
LCCVPCRLVLGIRHTKRSQLPPLRPFGFRSSGGSCSLLRSLPDLVGHPLAEIAVFGLGLAFLHKRDAGSAVRHAVAIENGQVHEPVVENVSHDRRERLSAVDMHKAPVAGKA